MLKIQFISAPTLKAHSVIQQNVDEKILNIAIKEFQELELEKMLGKTEYDRISDALVASIQGDPVVPLIPTDVSLMEAIRPVMLYGSLMYSISPLHIKITNMGSKVDDAQLATSADLAAARADYAFKLDGYKRKLIELINTSTETVKACGTAQDTTFNFTGIALPDYSPDIEKWYKDVYYKTGGGGIVLR